MPAYDHPIHIRVTPSQYAAPRADACAAVIRFQGGAADLVRIQAYLDRMVERGIIFPAKAQTYHSSETSAELYFP